MIRRYWKEIALLLSVIILASLMLEASLQLVYRMKNGRWLSANTAFRIGYTQPVKDRRQYTLRPGYTDRDNEIDINSLGFRGPAIPEEYKYVGVALGDSVPFGAGVKDRDTYPAILEALAMKRGVSLRVLNAGVPSYDLRQSFDRLKLDVLPHYKKPVWVTVQAANDISLLIQYGKDYSPDVTWSDLKLKGTWSWLDILAARSAICHYMKYKLAALGKKGGGCPVPDRMLKNVRSVLRENLEFLGAQGIPVILMPADPFYYQTENSDKNESLSLWKMNGRHAEKWNGLIEQYNMALEEAANSGFKDVYFFDTRKVLDGTERDKMYIDFFHHSREGNEVIAEALIDFLDSKGLLINGKMR